MAVTVETLEKLERRITLLIPANDLNAEIETRLKKLSRTVKADGFRPGKVPMSVVAQRYGYSVQSEVMNDKIGQAFASAANEAQLRVAGVPRVSPKDGAPEGQLAFEATFEVYPDVTLGDLSTVDVERFNSEVTDAAIDRTVDILRKQRRIFAQRPAAEGAAETDRVTIDFEGKIDGETFSGGKADAFQFIIGEGQMLEQFDKAVRGMKVGDNKTFPLQFPEDYHGKDVAGKEADFLVTMKKIEAQNLPELTEAFIQSLGIADGTVDGLRADVKKNLEREVKFRVLGKNKAAAMDALIQVATLDIASAAAAVASAIRQCASHGPGRGHARLRWGCPAAGEVGALGPARTCPRLAHKVPAPVFVAGAAASAAMRSQGHRWHDWSRFLSGAGHCRGRPHRAGFPAAAAARAVATGSARQAGGHCSSARCRRRSGRGSKRLGGQQRAGQ